MLKEDLLKLNLQFFADNPEDDPENKTDDPEDKDNPEDKSGNKDTFTKSEVDSQVSKAVETFKQNQEVKQQEAIDKAVKDALEEQKRLSKLSQKEREEEQLTQREKDIQEREAKIKRSELRSEAVDDLQKKELPSDFADFLLGEDAEKTLENINKFKKAFDDAVNGAVKEKLRQDTPPAGNSGTSSNKIPSVAKIAQENRLIK
ncbi:DUF4355 domain-containing protein [Oceanobacillus timonensis]|uniref:DUF4355 domain-containing protein n=1 Tax=Oceanobacillus timonensis TaxID=1926285 RepID=UPI0015C40F41|nr:DUF4355 domain-containing protein [Oceanobacillus timonensis]